jgi:hypothetical protein
MIERVPAAATTARSGMAKTLARADERPVRQGGKQI